MSLRRIAFSLYLAPRTSRTCVKHFHTSPAALKKKHLPKTSAFDDEAGGADDLFAVNYTSGSSVDASVVTQPLKVASSNLATIRAQRFLDHKATIEYRCDRKAADGKKRPQPRLGSLKRLIFLTDSAQQLEAVVDTLALWRQAGHPPCDETSSSFIGRCINLGRPDIALKVLASRPVYGVDLPSLATARALLHGILISSLERPDTSTPFTSSHMNDALLLVGLFPRFQLVEASQDPLCSRLLLALTAIVGTTNGPGSGFTENNRVLMDSIKQSAEAIERFPKSSTLKLTTQESVWLRASSARIEQSMKLQGMNVS